MGGNVLKGMATVRSLAGSLGIHLEQLLQVIKVLSAIAAREPLQ